MKAKLFMIATFATAIFTGCAKNETTSVNDTANLNSIGFEMGTGKVTRATSSNLTTLEGDAAGIGVYATYKATPVEYIANQAYKYDSEWKWDGTAPEWPAEADYPINFYAYHPRAYTTLTSTLTKEYTVGDVDAQIDYLAANKTGITSKPIDAKAALDFKHIMSQVKFQVAATAGVTVEVQSIKVVNVGKTATFNYGTLAWSVAPTAYTAEYEYATLAKMSDNQFTTATAADVTGDNGALILMPQNLTTQAWPATAAPTTESYIEVIYRVFNTADNKDIVGFTDATDHPKHTELNSTVTGALYVKVAYSLPTNWEMNKSYTYILHLGDPNYGGGKLIEDNFIDDNGGVTDLPVVNPGTGGDYNVPDDINNTSKKIGFDITVSDWESSTTEF